MLKMRYPYKKHVASECYDDCRNCVINQQDQSRFVSDYEFLFKNACQTFSCCLFLEMIHFFSVKPYRVKQKAIKKKTRNKTKISLDQ